MSRYATSGLWPVAATTTPPIRNAITAVSSGTTMPPLRCRSEIRATSVPVAAATSGDSGTASSGGGVTVMRPSFARRASPARSASRRRQRPAAAHVERLDELPRELDESLREQPAALGDRRPRVVVKGDVLGDGEFEDETAPLPILGDVAEAGVEHLARVRVVK